MYNTSYTIDSLIPKEQVLFSVQDLSNRFKISPDAILCRVRSRKIKPFTETGSSKYLFTEDQVTTLFLNYKDFKAQNDLEIIYVTRTIEILHSKINYLELKDL